MLGAEAEPAQGAGWLDPRRGLVCRPCLERYDAALYRTVFSPPSWDAVCENCGESMNGEQEDEPHAEEPQHWFAEAPRPRTEADAVDWAADHRCVPIVEIVPPGLRARPVHTIHPIGDLL
ncbi:hypothetical protein [Spongiactinospora sp. TRM90649]|uniref:hypothetical protein n=1 Tax=Spongiactinospora sp. TRM90649 TaxID=3031114 RepID=UPI0023F9ECDF|nr:hypothetical protein [Spongiactinospora sp. TRM90649]MDF5756611.1 hypothetical protein [Spongiactinospora sp. TRM90649]